MAIQIFWGSGSPYAWRVLLALEVKGLPYESTVIEFSKQQHKTPEFLAMNPRGKVPVLRDGDYSVYESLACLAYLDRKYPSPPLFGATPEEAGRIWRAVSESLCYLDRASDAVVDPVFFGRVKEKEASIREGIVQSGEELGWLEKDLARGPWLAGCTQPSAADLVAYTSVRLLLRALEKPAAAAFEVPFLPLAEKVPSVAAWMKRVEALPGYERTYPPHWRKA